MIGASYNPWSPYAALRTLPPLACLPSGLPSDPAQDMLAAIRAAGGCLEFSGRYDDRWVVLKAGGGVLRFPSPVGHRLVIDGHICRHPLDVPGLALRFARFIPAERMPKGFQFPIENERPHRWDSKLMEVPEEVAPTIRPEVLEAQKAERDAKAGRAKEKKARSYAQWRERRNRERDEWAASMAAWRSAGNETAQAVVSA